jgi:hypothetical protein
MKCINEAYCKKCSAKTALALICLFWLSILLGAITTHAAPPKNFRLEGSKIIHPDGTEFIPVGGNVTGYWSFWPYETLKYFDVITKAWNLNIIRVPCSIKGYQGKWRCYDVNNMDSLIQKYTEAGVVVMLDGHDWTGDGINNTETKYYKYSTTGKELGPNNPEKLGKINPRGKFLSHPFKFGMGGDTIYVDSEGDTVQEFSSQYQILIDFFKYWAVKYKNNPYVWFNPMNECGTASGYYYDSNGPVGVPEYWVTMHGEFVKEMRSVGFENMIVCDGIKAGVDHGSWWGGGMGKLDIKTSAILSKGQEVLNYDGKKWDNVMFAIHTYTDWGKDGGGQTLAAYIDELHRQGMAMLIGECGWYLSHEGSTEQKAYFNTWDYAFPKGIGICVWHLISGDGMAVTKDGTVADIGNDWNNPTGLSWMGKPLWEASHSGKFGLDQHKIAEIGPVIEVTKTLYENPYTVSLENDTRWYMRPVQAGNRYPGTGRTKMVSLNGKISNIQILHGAREHTFSPGTYLLKSENGNSHVVKSLFVK